MVCGVTCLSLLFYLHLRTIFSIRNIVGKLMLSLIWFLLCVLFKHPIRRVCFCSIVYVISCYIVCSWYFVDILYKPYIPLFLLFVYLFIFYMHYYMNICLIYTSQLKKTSKLKNFLKNSMPVCNNFFYCTLIKNFTQLCLFSYKYTYTQTNLKINFHLNHFNLWTFSWFR